MNHPTSIGVTVNLTRSSTVLRNKEEWLSDIRQYAKTHDGPLSATGISQLSGYIPSSDAMDDYPDLNFGFAFSDASTESADIPASYCSRITVGPYHVRPKCLGFFTVNSTDPFDPPLVYPNLLENSEDRKPLRLGAHWQLKSCGDKKLLERVRTAAKKLLVLATFFFQYRMDFKVTACVRALLLRIRKGWR